MTREANWCEPDGSHASPRLLPSVLTILGQFDTEEVLLDQDDIARLTGCSRSISKRCLVTLSDLGYLIEASDGAYRLAGAEPEAIKTGHGEDGTLDTAA